MTSKRYLGIDLTKHVAKAQGRSIKDIRAVGKTGPFNFLTSILQWVIWRFATLFSSLFTLIISIQEAILNLRSDTVQVFFWGRGNSNVMFSQAILLFIGASVGIVWLAGNGIAPQVIAESSPEQTFVQTTLEMSKDVIVENGTLETQSPKARLRVDDEVYVVRSGDTLTSIAERYDINVDSLRWANGLKKNATIKSGQKLKIPPGIGLLYTVVKGDTLESISAHYKVPEATIVDQNWLEPPYKLDSGTELFLANAVYKDPKPTTVVRRYTTITSSSKKSTPVTGPKFLSWPVVGGGGGISRCYSWSHDGIDIYAQGSKNPNILAAAPGLVTYAGYHCSGYRCGYAWVVEIDHRNGYSTIYGHLLSGSIKVKAGDVVERGQVIAKMGASGWAYGTHLHFQLNKGGFLTRSTLKPTNPAPHMYDPKSCR